MRKFKVEYVVVGNDVKLSRKVTLSASAVYCAVARLKYSIKSLFPDANYMAWIEEVVA